MHETQHGWERPNARGTRITTQRLVAGLAILVGGGAYFIYSFNAPAVEMPADTGEVTLLTYNLNAKIGPDDRTAVLIRDVDADVVCLQEVRPDVYDALVAQLGDEYPASLYRDHTNGYGGLAFFSKYELHDRQWIAPNEPAWLPSWIVDADTPAGRIQLLNVHLRPRIADTGGKVVGHFTAGGMHRTEITALAGLLKKGAATVVIGDFNEFDGDPAIRVLTDREFSNALPPFGNAPTWHGEYLGVKIRSCIDHVLYSRDFDCVEARVIDGGASDHQPLMAKLHRSTTNQSTSRPEARPTRARANRAA